MCGLAGMLGLKALDKPNVSSVTRQMIGQLHHRGPDDQGVWCDTDAGIALGHRRLSILDLSPEGHQPMHSACGRYVIAFNGEVYNFGEIKAALEKQGADPKWRGHSDTEVVLAAISAWGLKQALARFVGMFAFAIWDRLEHCLYLSRDRLGEKPIYYGWCGNVFLFGSELKALRAHPAWRGEIDRDALALYFRHNYVPTPYSIYRGVFKLVPGTYLQLTAEDALKQDLPQPVTYWSAKHVAEEGTRRLFQGDEREAISQLEHLLREVVAGKMVADVPLGAFLSGGIDSSTVVALMQAQSRRPVKTFTIGFYEQGYNEAEYAREVAKHLGTDHTELYVTPEEVMDVILRLPDLYDEPFSDSSQIPTFLISQLARRHVTVSLSGDGGDELFAGYNRYFWGRNIWKTVGWMPRGMREMAARAVTAVSPQGWDRLFDSLGPLLPSRIKQQAPGDKLHKLADILSVDSPEAMYHGLVSHWRNPASVVLCAGEPPTILTDKAQWANLSDFTQRMMYLDTVSYLPDDILVKVDRASMAVSLEARVPFLDHRVVEFAWRIPLSMKIRQGQGKWLLRQVLYCYVPKALIERPKTGFGIPLDRWLRGPLREWAEELLDEKRLKDEGFFNPAPIREKWLEHLSGKRSWQYHLWDVLMFQAWKERWC
ncbi:MAG: asparagine synthase (glutamine-hydrolyzing) [Nitrospirota bacterium]